jgi:translation initiation factor 1
MDLQEQLKNLFPDHEPEVTEPTEKTPDIWLQEEPVICKYEKRKGKPLTILEGYTGADKDFKALTKELKKTFSTGGSNKNDTIIIQGDFRDQIMDLLRKKGFKVKRIGG